MKRHSVKEVIEDGESMSISLIPISHRTIHKLSITINIRLDLGVY